VATHVYRQLHDRGPAPIVRSVCSRGTARLPLSYPDWGARPRRGGKTVIWSGESGLVKVNCLSLPLSLAARKEHLPRGMENPSRARRIGGEAADSGGYTKVGRDIVGGGVMGTVAGQSG
jgi:hypothetical protein